MEYERRVAIARPVGDVFAFLCDETRLPEWRDGLRVSRRMSPPGDLHGARYAETLETPLGLRTVTVELAARPPHQLAFRVVDGPVRPRGTLTLRATAAGTELAYRLEYTPPLRIVTPLDTKVFGALRASVDRSLAKLVALLDDAGPGPWYPRAAAG